GRGLRLGRTVVSSRALHAQDDVSERTGVLTLNAEGGSPMTSNKNDLDLPLLPSAEQIRRREFATGRRGYDPDQVREYLQGVAGQVETLERELREQRKTTPSPSPGDDLAPAGAPTAPAL